MYNDQKNQNHFHNDVNVYNFFQPSPAVVPEVAEVWDTSQNPWVNALLVQNSSAVGGFSNLHNNNQPTGQGYPSNCNHNRHQGTSGPVTSTIKNSNRLAACSSSQPKQKKKKKNKANRKAANMYKQVNNRPDPPKRILGFGSDASYIKFQHKNKFLHFELESVSPYILKKFKISNRDTAYLEKKSFAFKGYYLDELYVIDHWEVTPNENVVLDTAKYALFIAKKLRSEGATALEKIFNRRLADTVLSLRSWRLSVLYLVHIIMAMETVNYDLRSGPGRPICNKFEEMLTNSKQNIFRRLVLETPSIEQRQELFSLRCKWETYFTKAGLKAIDRGEFWSKEAYDLVNPAPPLSFGTPTIQNITSGNNFGYGKVNQNLNPGNRVTPQRRIVEVDLISPTLPSRSTITPQQTSNANCTVTSNINYQNIVAARNSEDLVLETLNPIMETFLNIDWLENFPLSEKDKRKFTDMYSSEKPSGKNVVVLYNKKIEFSLEKFKTSKGVAVAFPEKDIFIAAAKEAHFIAKCFGKNEVSAMSQMLIADMAVAPNRINTKLDRLKSLLLVHIILSAEATQSLYKQKISRPFSNAFSTDAFVLNFRRLVAFSSNKSIKQKLYWMRLGWNSCLLDEFLYKIDDANLWTRNGVQLCEIPADLRPKGTFMEDSGEEVCIIAQIDKKNASEEVAVVVLESSDDEDGEIHDDVEPEQPTNNLHLRNIPNNPRIQGSNQAQQNLLLCTDLTREDNNQNQSNYVTLFKTYRNNLWNAKFFMDDYCLSKLRQKFDFSGHCNEEDDSKKKMAMELFSKSVHDILPSINEPKFLNLAKEAFFIETKFFDLSDITNFLVKIMNEGFEYCKSKESKLTSRLIGFLIIHTIIAIESVEPLIVPGVTDRWYGVSFDSQQAHSNAKILIRSVEDQGLRRKLRFLKLTWSIRDKASISESLNAKFKDNHNKEGSFFKDIIECIKEMYETNKATYDREKEKFRCRKRVDEMETDSCDESSSELNPSKKSRPAKSIARHVEPWKVQEHFETSTGLTERNGANETIPKKTTSSFETLFVPDPIIVVPSTSQNSASSRSEGQTKKTSVSGNSSSTLSISPSGLVGIDDKPLRLESSNHAKAIENIRKRLQERNQKKKMKGASEEQKADPPSIKEVQIDNFESGALIDNLLTPTLTTFDIVYNEDGTAQVKFIHST